MVSLGESFSSTIGLVILTTQIPTPSNSLEDKVSTQ